MVSTNSSPPPHTHTFSPWELYQYSDQILKHLPSDALKTLQKTLLFSKKPVHFAKKEYDRRNYNSQDLTLTGLRILVYMSQICDV